MQALITNVANAHKWSSDARDLELRRDQAHGSSILRCYGSALGQVVASDSDVVLEFACSSVLLFKKMSADSLRVFPMFSM